MKKKLKALVGKHVAIRHYVGSGKYVTALHLYGVLEEGLSCDYCINVDKVLEGDYVILHVEHILKVEDNVIFIK